MASKKLSSDTSLANSYKLSRGVASVARPSAPTIGTATNTDAGAMSVTFTASTLGPSATSYTLTSSSGVTGSGSSSPLTLTEVAIGTYTYSVYGTNANGNGPSSAASNSVVVASIYNNSYESIATTTVGSGGTSSISFTSIPSTYTHLQIRMLARTDRATSQGDYIRVVFNSDTAANYAYHELQGYGGNALSGGSVSSSFAIIQRFSGSLAAANVFGAGYLDILDYANTNKYKTTRALGGWDDNTNGNIQFNSSLWMSTTAINSITITPGGGTSILQYSQAALYGIKG